MPKTPLKRNPKQQNSPAEKNSHYKNILNDKNPLGKKLYCETETKLQHFGEIQQQPELLIYTQYILFTKHKWQQLQQVTI